MRKETAVLALTLCLVFVLIAFVSTLNREDAGYEVVDETSIGYNIEEIDRYESVEWEQKEIVGNVKVPGIYEVPTDTTLIELIECAGGVKKMSPLVILEVMMRGNKVGSKVILKSE